MEKRVVIVGAGIGGLSAALLLAREERRATVLEAHDSVGGKARRLPSAAGPVDAGPTVFTMRPVFEELFEAVGASLEDHVRLTPAEILARHFWSDGSRLDLMADMGASENAVEAFAGARAAGEFRAFTRRARVLFDAFEGPVMRDARPTPLRVAAALGTRGAKVLSALGVRPTLAGALDAQFSDPRLAQLFQRYSTYVGGSPWLSPAVLMLIWRAESAGVWHVDGGMAALARAIGDLAETLGASIRTGAMVRRVLTENGGVTGVELADGERIGADAVLFNGDPSALSEGLLGASVEGAAPRLERAGRSLSAWVWTFAGVPEGVDLAADNVFFSADYRAEFDDLFGARRLPRDPTLYVFAQDRTTGGNPPSPERLMMIMNAPADGDRGAPTTEEMAACETRVFGRLAASGLRLEPPGAAAITIPAEFARLFPGNGGAIYGAAPHGMMATFRRPMTRTKVAGLYLAGGGAHPGPGVAMSCLSGRLAAAAIAEDLGST